MIGGIKAAEVPDSPAEAGGGVALDDMPGDRVDTGTGVPLQGPYGRVAGAGQQHRRRGAVLGVVRERTVTKSVKRPHLQGCERPGILP